MPTGSKLLDHVEEHTAAAADHLARALRMIREDPQPGLAMWLISLGQDLQAAADEIAKAQIAP